MHVQYVSLTLPVLANSYDGFLGALKKRQGIVCIPFEMENRKIDVEYIYAFLLGPEGQG